MNAYAAYVQQRMDALQLTAAEVERRGGPTRQVMSTLLKDAREVLPRPPDRATITKLAAVFDGGKEQRLWLSVAQAMGLPVAAVEAPRLSDLTDTELIAEVSRRLHIIQVPHHGSQVSRDGAPEEQLPRPLNVVRDAAMEDRRPDQAAAPPPGTSEEPDT